jgi:hypothetical protein
MCRIVKPKGCASYKVLGRSAAQANGSVNHVIGISNIRHKAHIDKG